MLRYTDCDDDFHEIYSHNVDDTVIKFNCTFKDQDWHDNKAIIKVNYEDDDDDVIYYIEFPLDYRNGTMINKQFVCKKNSKFRISYKCGGGGYHKIYLCDVTINDKLILCDENGFSEQGYDRYGYDRYGYNRDGYDRKGYDCNDYDSNGNDSDSDDY